MQGIRSKRSLPYETKISLCSFSARLSKSGAPIIFSFDRLPQEQRYERKSDVKNFMPIFTSTKTILNQSLNLLHHTAAS